MVEATPYTAEGPQPVLIHFASTQNEIDWVIGQAIQLSKNSSTVVIFRNRLDIHKIKDKISINGISATIIDKDTPGFANVKRLYLSTFHAAKGLEFDNVIVPYMNAERFPDLENINDSRTDEEIYADEIKLLYVAVTRSKYGLYMTYSGELSKLFPKNSTHYKLIEEEDL